MTTFVLISLFVLGSIAVLLTLADSVVRGRNAYKELKGVAAKEQSDPIVTVSLSKVAQPVRLPNPMMVSTLAYAPRRAAANAQSYPLIAAA